ncbi:unnamed protein product [Trichobilharzia szidati]|nr:unnamed protein product [Trichobilharzia szidati]
MNQILSGILKFTKVGKDAYLKQLKGFSEKTKPLAAIISCVDSRVIPSKFLCSNIGEVFIERNPGNFICCENSALSHFSEVCVTPGFLDFILFRCKINDIIICGHSDCRAMGLLNNFRNCIHDHTIHKNVNETAVTEPSPLEKWIWENGKKTLQNYNPKSGIISFSSSIHPGCPTLELDFTKINELTEVDKLSQANVLQQMINIYSYQVLLSQLTQRRLRVHGMWFTLHSGDIHLYSRLNKAFLPVNQETISSLTKELN